MAGKGAFDDNFESDDITYCESIGIFEGGGIFSIQYFPFCLVAVIILFTFAGESYGFLQRNRYV